MHVIAQKCAILCKAYMFALDEMNSWKWSDCCKASLEYLNPIGLTYATNFETVMRWNRQFCDTEKFPHPNPNISNGKPMESLLFELYPEVKNGMMEYCNTNLADLTAERVHSKMVDEILPNVEDDNPRHQGIITKFNVRPASITTIFRRMK